MKTIRSFQRSDAAPQADELETAAQALAAARSRLDAALGAALDAGMPAQYVAQYGQMSMSTVNRHKAARKASTT